MIAGVFAHHIDHARLRLAGIVQIGKSIAKTGGQMQQRGRHPPRHAVIAIRRPRGPAFKQTQDAAHLGVAIKGGNEMHL